MREAFITASGFRDDRRFALANQDNDFGVFTLMPGVGAPRLHLSMEPGFFRGMGSPVQS